jgi:hypothetical protein
MSFHPLPKPLNDADFAAIKEIFLRHARASELLEWLHKVQAYLLGEQHAPAHPTAVELIALFQSATRTLDECNCDACTCARSAIEKISIRYRAQLNDAGFSVSRMNCIDVATNSNVGGIVTTQRTECVS